MWYARHNLATAYLRLLSLAEAGAPAQLLPALTAAMRPAGDLVELQIARAVVGLAQAAQSLPDVLHFLAAGEYAAWATQLAAAASKLVCLNCWPPTVTAVPGKVS